MSSDYRPTGKILFDDLFTKTLAGGRIREHIVHRVEDIETSETTRCLTDGVDYIWVFRDDFGFVHRFTQWAPNRAGFILQAVIDAFDTEILSEYEPRYGGFDTHEEWEAALEAIHPVYEGGEVVVPFRSSGPLRHCCSMRRTVELLITAYRTKADQRSSQRPGRNCRIRS
jgi:hypothetical protein